MERGHLLTEQVNAAAAHLDQLSAAEFVALMQQEDAKVAVAVAQEQGAIATAIEQTTAALRQGGRLFYVGAGTSGRLGVLDAAECPPTFQTDPTQVQGLIAGGLGALVRSVEGAEDSATAGAAAIATHEVGPLDVVVGIAAGGTTPFVHGAIAAARERQALTIFLACVPVEQVAIACDVDIRPLVGPEVLAGSTRLKAGTATKLVLNTLSTGVMVQLGKVYDQWMVDVAVTNEKLWDRALRIMTALTDLNRDEARILLETAQRQVKPALLMHWSGCTLAEAEAQLAAHGGHLRQAKAAFLPNQ